jgi:hypothetical protein
MKKWKPEKTTICVLVDCGQVELQGQWPLGCHSTPPLVFCLSLYTRNTRLRKHERVPYKYIYIGEWMLAIHQVIIAWTWCVWVLVPSDSDQWYQQSPSWGLAGSWNTKKSRETRELATKTQTSKIYPTSYYSQWSRMLCGFFSILLGMEAVNEISSIGIIEIMEKTNSICCLNWIKCGL